MRHIKLTVHVRRVHLWLESTFSASSTSLAPATPISLAFSGSSSKYCRASSSAGASFSGSLAETFKRCFLSCHRYNAPAEPCSNGWMQYCSHTLLAELCHASGSSISIPSSLWHAVLLRWQRVRCWFVGCFLSAKQICLWGHHKNAKPAQNARYLACCTVRRTCSQTC